MYRMLCVCPGGRIAYQTLFGHEKVQVNNIHKKHRQMSTIILGERNQTQKCAFRLFCFISIWNKQNKSWVMEGGTWSCLCGRQCKFCLKRNMKEPFRGKETFYFLTRVAEKQAYIFVKTHPTLIFEAVRLKMKKGTESLQRMPSFWV